MIEKKISLINKLGLHARAANKLLDVTTQYASNISIEFQDKTADGKSIMSVMLLAAPFGSELTLTAEGQDEQEMMAAVCKLIDQRFGEPE